MSVEDVLERARECYGRRKWSEAYRLLSLADRSADLGAEDLERLAAAAYLVGRETEFYRHLERAHFARLRRDEPLSAARGAFWLGLTLTFRGETARANGWLARAHRLVESRECAERGYLLLPVAERRLRERDGDAAIEAATLAADIGERFADADLIACARHLQGRALIREQRVERGLELLDEVMVAASAGELSPIVTGLIYCSVIDACREVFALSRAREWTEALRRWCERQPEMVAFTGTCLVHRAEVLQFRGSWAEAMAETQRAHERAGEDGAREPAAAFYRRGEIHRLRGELDAAEQEYRNASRSGVEPQPGLALLRLAQGRTAAARSALRRVLEATADPLRRASLLPAYVEVALAAGDVPEARDASAELHDIAERYGTDVLQALASDARGAIALAEGRARDALRDLHRALALWRQGEAPYESARTRLRIAETCRRLGDAESAELELDAARASLDRLGAATDVARAGALLGTGRRTAAHGLTPRELQVLRRIAAGKTNRAIAAELAVSLRTVDRHVSNILNKLGVPSRAAATAYAYEHDLL